MPVSHPIAFVELVEQMREQINAALESHAVFSESCPPRLGEAIRYGLLGSGKRLRPILVLLAAEACGSDCESALPAACAVEMVHAYSLIHDDLPAMDNDDLRRGQPSCHRAFDEATAILAGDALLTRALEVMATKIHPAETAMACSAVLARAAGAEGMVGGQVRDLESACSSQVVGSQKGIDDLQAIHRGKTGAMFAASLQIGGRIGGAADDELAMLESYGEKIGLAFQIVDDLLDVSGDEVVTGKRVQKDDRLGKLTFPGLYGTRDSKRLAEQLIERACDGLEPFGSRAAKLKDLAAYLAERDS